MNDTCCARRRATKEEAPVGMFGFDDQYVMFGVTPLDNQFILEYMPTSKGDDVKVYLYGLVRCYHPLEDLSVKEISHELNMTEEAVLSAFRHWERMGLVRRVSDNPPMYRYLSATQQLMMGTTVPVDPAYEDFSEALFAAFGKERRLHGGEISRCFEWVEELGLPTEVVLQLIQHMIALRGKNFSIASAEKLAMTLADARATTAEDAEQILSREKQVWAGSRKLLRRMGKRRDPSEDEMNLYRKWLREWGCSPDAIEAACVETTKGEPTFAYLDGILRGMLQRQGTLSSGREVERQRTAEQKRIEPLKKLLSAMNIRGTSINEGTLAVYDDMRKLYPDEIILLAGQETAKRGGDLTDVMALLSGWKERGLESEEDVRSHIARFNSQSALLRKLYENWGLKNRPSAADRTLLVRWTEEWGFTESMVSFTASLIRDAEKPMLVLNKKLEGYRERGITTEEQAAADESAWQERRGKEAAGKKQGRVLKEQQYEQREYTEPDALPDWVQKRMEDENGHA